ncbi:MAG: alpha/beta hydrolase [Nitrospirales bacterium]|nr:alpha/beta hydrolase [Nitrospirales bacterium]
MLDQHFVYFPAGWSERHWRQISGLPLEDVWIPVNQGVRVFGWFVDAGPKKPVLLWCHGNAGNISHRLQNLIDLYRGELSVFLFDYRGYGKSTGSPSESGLYADALASYEYLIRERGVVPERLVLFGRSLGAAVAGEVATQRAAAGLILESAFPSMQAMADEHYLGLPANWFVDAEYHLNQKLANVTIPTCVIHGENDEIVPIALGKQVYEAARHPKTWYMVPGAGHNDVPYVGGRSYYRQIFSFIQKVVP